MKLTMCINGTEESRIATGEPGKFESNDLLNLAIEIDSSIFDWKKIHTRNFGMGGQFFIDPFESGRYYGITFVTRNREEIYARFKME